MLIAEPPPEEMSRGSGGRDQRTECWLLTSDP